MVTDGICFISFHAEWCNVTPCGTKHEKFELRVIASRTFFCSPAIVPLIKPWEKKNISSCGLAASTGELIISADLRFTALNILGYFRTAHTIYSVKQMKMYIFLSVLFLSKKITHPLSFIGRKQKQCSRTDVQCSSSYFTHFRAPWHFSQPCDLDL